MITMRHRTKERRVESVAVRWCADHVTFSESQLLATVSRDLQQPLLTLDRLREILAEKVKDKEAFDLIARLNGIASVLADMLDTLFDLNQLETGIVRQERIVEPWRPAIIPAELRLAGMQGRANPPTIFVVDHDRIVREAMVKLFEEEGWLVEAYQNGEAFIKAYSPSPERQGCLVMDAWTPGLNGLELIEYMRNMGGCLPTILMADHADIRLAVRAMKAGAAGFLEKPFQLDELLTNINRALELARNSVALSSLHATVSKRIAGLTTRERQVMELVVEGNPNKQIAYVLGINQRTVETHRATVMKKIGARSLSELIHLTIVGLPQGI